MKVERRSFWVSFLVMLAIVFGLSTHSQAETRFGFYCIAPPASPVIKVMEILKKDLAEDSDGEIAVDLYPSGQLGPESAGLNKLKIGAVKTAAITGVAISKMEPKANALMLPFVFDNWAEVKDFCQYSQGDYLNDIEKSLDKKGLKLLGVGSYGFFNMLATEQFLTSPEDFKGVKIRVYPTKILIDLYKALGASPTPISFPEIYTALQQGVIEATDGTLDSAYASKQYEVAKYLTRTKHLHGFFLYLANKSWFEGLPQEIQTQLETKFREYALMEIEKSESFADKMLKLFKEKGVETKALKPEQRQELKEATREVHTKYSKKIGNDLVDKFYSEMDFQ